MDEKKLEVGGGQQESGLFYVCGHSSYLFKPTTAFSFKPKDSSVNFPCSRWVTLSSTSISFGLVRVEPVLLSGCP